MALMFASPTEIIDKSGRAVVSILRPLETAQPDIVVPSVRMKTMTDKAATFLQPFDLVRDFSLTFQLKVVINQKISEIMATDHHPPCHNLVACKNQLALFMCSQAITCSLRYWS